MELKPGSNFKGFYLKRLLGKGGFGSVYEVVKIEGEVGNLPQRAALKVLHPAHAKDEKTVRRFHREAKLALKLNHPHTVKILDSGTHEENHFILMEYVEGKTLLNFMKPSLSQLSASADEVTQSLASGKDEKTLSLEELPTLQIQTPAPEDTTLAFNHFPVPSKELTLKLIRQCAEALAAASLAGLVHRDIKPENILVQDLDGEPHVKILDFGLAKNLIDQSMQLSMAGQAMGTPAYMSPEQWKGEALDARADLYSLGVSFYTFVTGEKAFPSTSMKDLMRQILVEKIQRADEVRLSVDKDIADLLEKMMMKDPEERFQSAEALIQAIDQISDQTKAFFAIIPARSGKFSLLVWFFFAFIAAVFLGLFFYFSRPLKVESKPLADQPARISPPFDHSVLSPAQRPLLPSGSSEKTDAETGVPVSVTVQMEGSAPLKPVESSESENSSPELKPSLPLEQTAILSPLLKDTPSLDTQKKAVSGFSEDLKGEIKTKESDRLKKLLSQKNVQNSTSQH